MGGVPGPAAPPERPAKRAKQQTLESGPELRATALHKCILSLPAAFSPGAVQANRLALLVDDAEPSRAFAYVANAQHVYQVPLDLDALAAAGGMELGKEGVLVPRAVEAPHTRQLRHASMLAEVQMLHAARHGGYHVLAVADALGNVCLLARAAAAAAAGGLAGTLDGGGGGGGSDGGADSGGADGGGSGGGSDGGLHVMRLLARSRGEAGWVGVDVRPLSGAVGGQAAAAAAAASGGGSSGGGGGPPPLEVAVARQRARDVCVFRDGALALTLHTAQGATALRFLPPGSYGGCDAAGGLLAVAEEHQVTLWDARQGGCVQRLSVYGGGAAIYSLDWLPAPAADAPAPGAAAAAAGTAAGGGGGGGPDAGGQEARGQRQGAGQGKAPAAQPRTGMLALTGGERSVVLLEPKRWTVAAKWQGAVKYPATHMALSPSARGCAYVAGLDFECAAGRCDGSSGSSAGNANSGSGGHGRAVGPAAAQLAAAGSAGAGAAGGAAEEAAAAADMQDGGGGHTGAGLTFRGDSKWIGLARAAAAALPGGGSRDVVAALTQSGHLFVLQASAVGA